MTDEYRRLRMVINVDIEADNARRVNSVLHVVERSKVLQKKMAIGPSCCPWGPLAPKLTTTMLNVTGLRTAK